MGCIRGTRQRESKTDLPQTTSTAFARISGESTRHAVDNLAEPDRAAGDRRPAMMSSRAARDIQKPPSRMPGRRVDFKVAAAGYPSTNVGEGAAACQAAIRCSSAGASNCSSSVEPDRAVIELLPPVTA